MRKKFEILFVFGLLLLTSVFLTDTSAQEIEVAQVKGPGIDLTVTGACLNGDAVFRIVNNGGDWPKRREILVYRSKGDILINKRKLQMLKNDSATFKVRGAAKSGADLGLVVGGGDDVTRLPPYHATLHCGK